MWTAVGMLLSRMSGKAQAELNRSPALRWAVIVIVALLGVEFVAREGISLMRAAAELPVYMSKQSVDLSTRYSPEELKTRVCSNAVLRKTLGTKYGCPPDQAK